MYIVINDIRVLDGFINIVFESFGAKDKFWLGKNLHR